MCIAFLQKFIDKIRRKIRNNISECNNIQIPKEILGNVRLHVVGKDNNIVIKNKNLKGFVNINIFGNNNTVILDDNVFLSQKMSILIGQNHTNFGEVNNSRFFIGKNTSVESLNYITFNSNTFCEIEEDCMLSYDITIYNTDGHPIFNKDTKEIINKVKGVRIGKHSWIGFNTTIMKNSVVPAHSIIGCHSVFAGGG